jgi:magnesium chelatase subunit I
VGYGEPLTIEDRVRIVELPLNAELRDVVGGIDERLALEQRRLRLEQGILAQADGNILYIDEVNLLDDSVSDAILDAASQGFYTVRRGPLNLQYRARFLLIGSMNPEEGNLRPQIMDRFGLRVVVRGLADPELRYQAYEQAVAYGRHPEHLAAAFAEETMLIAQEVERARSCLPEIVIGGEAKDLGLDIIQKLGIASSRAEITLFEAARAHAAADDRSEVLREDIEAVTLISLRMRQTTGLREFMRHSQSEDDLLRALIDGDTSGQGGKRSKAKS